jgi:hypothetical protein
MSMSSTESEYLHLPPPEQPADGRCGAVSRSLLGVRCQLLRHDDDRHVAMIDEGPLLSPILRYATWGESSSGPWVGRAQLNWAPTFPQVESD